MTAAELLRSVTRALSSASDEEAFAALPGSLERGEPGELAWEDGTLSVPVPGVGVLRVPTAEPDDGLLAAAESVSAQLSLFAAVRDMEARRRAMLDVAFDSVVTMDDRGVVLSVNRAAERLFGYSAAEMIGREVAELIVPPSLRDAHRHGLERYLKTGRGPVVGRRVELTAMRYDGDRVPRRARGDATRRPRRSRLLRLPARPDRALRRRDRAAPAGRRAGGAAAGRDGGRGRARLRAAVRARQRGGRAAASRPRRRTCSASTPTAPAGAIVGGWALRTEHVLPVGTRMPLDGDTAATRVWRTGRAARMDSYETAEGELAATMRSYGVRAVVAAPIFLGGSLWGAVVVSSMEPEPFPADAEQRISYFAELAAQALANAQAREELAASRARIVAAGDAERRRLERNLHDGAQQRLVSLALMLRLAARRHPDDADLARAGEELTHALQELRELARGIHPAVLTERGLEPAVRAVADRAPLPVELEVDLGDERLPGPVEAAAYYVVSEALTNVAKYANASLVRIRVERDNGIARIEVSDDGAGGAHPDGGTGLRGLADRVEALAGRLTIDSPLGAGTTLRAEIPT